MYTLLIILTALIIMVYYLVIERVLVDALKKSNEKTIEQYLDKISYKANVYIALSKSMTSNLDIQEVLRMQDEIKLDDTIAIHLLFNNTINRNLLINDISELYSITIYALNKDFPTDGKFISNIYREHNEEWLSQIKGKQGIITFKEGEGYDGEILSFIEPIIDYEFNHYGELLGYVKIEVEADGFFDFGEEIEAFSVKDSRGQTIYGMDLDGNDKNINERDFKLGKENFYGEFTLSYIFSYKQLNKQSISSRWYLVAILSTLFLGMLFVRRNVIRNYLSRINKIISKMKTVEKGDFKTLSIDGGKDEIGILDQHFNEMAQKLDALISKNYMQELENREAKIKALQYQIDPHFLFNTLESINALAIINDNEDISNIIESLGLIYRYIVDKETGDVVSLNKEISHVKNYMLIQQYRFGFEVETDIERETERCLVPKLIIQPFIENAINYAKGMAGKKLKLKIGTKRVKENLIIEIEDNGIGMSEEIIKKIKLSMGQKDIKGKRTNKISIGINNVDQRIKLNYGENYGVKIDSQDGLGTKVKLTIPFQV